MGDARLSIDEILLKLKDVRKSGSGWVAKCPSHEDHTASLSVSEGREGRILFKCFAHCTFQQIREALGLSISDLMPKNNGHTPFPQPAAVYQYRDLDGKVRYEVVRYNEPKKKFLQRQPSPGGPLWHLKGIKKLPYRLPELRGHLTVYIVEGEKDADTLWRIGLPATTNSGGGGKSKWSNAESEMLVALGVIKVIILPDNDDTGRQHAEDVAAQMKAHRISWTIVALPELSLHGDVSDWIAAGHTRVDLEHLVATTPYIVRAAGIDTTPPPVNDPHGAGRWELTDAGAAEALTARLRDTLRFDFRHDRWLLWNHHHWRPDNVRGVERLALDHFRLWRKQALDIRDEDLREEVQKYARGCENSARFENVLKRARPMDGIASAGHEWDQDDFLFGCPNGVIDLHTGTLRDGKPSDHITLQSNVTYQPDALAPEWERFLADIFDGDREVVGFVQRALGFSLTGKMEPAVFFMCIGHGSNGKSTFLNAVNHVWGRYAYTTSMATFTVSATGAENDFNLAELDGPRLVVASEAKIGSTFNEQLLKNYTGGEKVNAQRKHGRPFEFQPKGKIWMGLNHQPAVKDDSHGFWRRMQVITFPRTFEGSSVDLKLAEKLRAEGPGILAWAIRGCLRWQEEGLNPPLSVQLKVEEYKDEEDPNREFLVECVDFSEADAEESMHELYTSYTAFCTKTGRKFTQSRKSFGKYLSRKFEKRESNGKVIYRGVRLRFRPQERLY